MIETDEVLTLRRALRNTRAELSHAGFLLEHRSDRENFNRIADRFLQNLPKVLAEADLAVTGTSEFQMEESR